MSIKPIDLQTLFVQMNHVGKDVASEKNAALLQQSQAGSELVDKNIKSDHSVNKTQELEKEDSTVKEKDEESANEQESQNPEEKEKTKKEKDVYSDPEIGLHVDISG